MIKRTTIEIDQDLLERAKRALGHSTTRATVEDALRLAAERAEDEQARHTAKQRQYLEQLDELVDPAVLASDEMWR